MNIAERFFQDESSTLGVAFVKYCQETQDTLDVNTLLDIGFVKESIRILNLPSKVSRELMEYRGQLASDQALKDLFVYLHYCYFYVPDYPLDRMANWPAQIYGSEKETGLFYLLLLVTGVPKLRRFYKEQSLPVEAFEETIADIRRRARFYELETGKCGIEKKAIVWFTNHFRGKLFQLGRLQFVLGTLRNKITVFKNTKTNLVLALSNIDAHQDNKGFRGRPILPNGDVLEEDIFLPFNKWKQVLTTEDPILDIHIPAGDSLSKERCRSSFKSALDFFPRHYPEHNFKALVCNAWLLDNQFQKILAPTTNIVLFQREFYLVPISTVPKDILNRIFGNDFSDISEVKPKTTLQRVALEHISKGHQFQGGGGFLLPDDVETEEGVYIDQIDNLKTAISALANKSNVE